MIVHIQRCRSRIEAAAEYPQNDWRIFRSRSRHHHIYVQTILRHFRIRIPHRSARKIPKHRVHNLHTRSRQLRCIYDARPLFGRSRMTITQRPDRWLCIRNAQPGVDFFTQRRGQHNASHSTLVRCYNQWIIVRFYDASKCSPPIFFVRKKKTNPPKVSYTYW